MSDILAPAHFTNDDEYDVDLHALADAIGMPASALRVGLISLCSQYLGSATVDDNLTFYQAWAGAVFTAQAVSLAAAGTDDVYFNSAQAGALILSCHPSTGKAVPGFGFAISGAGADDDVVVLCEVFGVLPDGKTLVKQLRGSGVVYLPSGVVITSSIYVRLTNQTGTAVVVHLEGFAKAATDGAASSALRKRMQDQGIPVGRASASRRADVAGIVGRIGDLQGRIKKAAEVGGPAALDHARKQVGKEAREFLSGMGKGWKQRGKALLRNIND